MSSITVKTQDELTAALAVKPDYIYVESEKGNWLVIRETPEDTVIFIRGNATVKAWDNATVEAWDNATVKAWGSATVKAWGSATVKAGGNATVKAWGSATVEAGGNATVEAWDNATVEAWDNATVKAKNAVRLALLHRASAKVGPLVSVHLFGPHAKAEGGHQIIVPPIHTVQDWVNYHNVERRGEYLVVFKAVRADLHSKHGALYEIGTEVIARDWDARDFCGGGLHFSATPREARRYDREATRFLKCLIPAAETTVVGQGEFNVDKVKSRMCQVLEEVDADGEPLKVTAE